MSFIMNKGQNLFGSKTEQGGFKRPSIDSSGKLTWSTETPESFVKLFTNHATEVFPFVPVTPTIFLKLYLENLLQIIEYNFLGNARGIISILFIFEIFL